jgi:proteic killer suppression protein
MCQALPYKRTVIKTFRHKALGELWAKGRTARIDMRLQARILRRLDALDAASLPADLNLPGFDFHGLRGFDPPRYTIHVNGPWCITFEFADGDAFQVDLEQYH